MVFPLRPFTTPVMLLMLLCPALASAQDKPYFVTYDHTMEDSGDLEFSVANGVAIPRASQNGFMAPYLELEYGVTPRWTTEFTFEGQSTWHDSTVFTGWRLENRFKLLQGEHKVNPVLYFEYENVNEASRILKEVVGEGMDLDDSNAELRGEHAHEFEGKLILSSTIHGWNISENFLTEKDVTHGEPFEFGYAFGLARPLATAGGKFCRLCRANFIAGIEAYGGLGSLNDFGFANTAHYLAPVLMWKISEDSALKFSPAIGLTGQSVPVFLRFGYTYEIEGFRDRLVSLLRGKK